MNEQSLDKASVINTIAQAVICSQDLNWPKIIQCMQSPLEADLTIMARAIQSFPDAPWADAFSKGQLRSKLWLIDELTKIQTSFSCVYTMGGWLGVLPWLMFRDQRMTVDKIRSFDLDPACQPPADKLNIDNTAKSWKFKAITENALTMVFSSDSTYELVGRKSNNTLSKPVHEKPDCIINTSCDHFDDIRSWIYKLPNNVPIVLQNTNTKHDDTHVAHVESVEEFMDSVNLRKVLFSGSLDLDTYKRFMVIGHK